MYMAEYGGPNKYLRNKKENHKKETCISVKWPASISVCIQCRLVVLEHKLPFSNPGAKVARVPCSDLGAVN